MTPPKFALLTKALRKTLSPVDLVNALGYEFTVPAANHLPVQLIEDLLEMTARERAEVAGLVHRRVRPMPGKEERSR